MTRPVNRPHKKPGRVLTQPPANAARRITALAATGHSVVGIARGLNTSNDTFRRWIEEYPDLAEALVRGRESERFALHNYLFRTAMDPRVAAKDRNFAAVYLLNNRHGYVSGDQSESANKVSITFTLPSALKPEDFKVIEHEPEADAIPVPGKSLTRT
jgi:hypothetical protein